MKSAFSKRLLIIAIVVSLVLPTSFAVVPPKKTEATSGCVGTAIGALGLSKLASSMTSVPVSDKVTQGTTGGSFIADCILTPIAIKMARAMVRNISNSIVNWINNDFKGKPSFITNIDDTISDSADEAIGNFIYGSDLKFLCEPFSFQIRLALATKYQRGFDEEIRCTLTDVENNISDFGKNNGGAGWDNWLKMTTEPQNNVYSAYLMAESELASKIQGNLNKVNDMLNRNGGFLDFQVCNKWADPMQTSGIINDNAIKAKSNQFVTTTNGSNFNVQTTLLGQSTQGIVNTGFTGTQTFSVPTATNANSLPSFKDSAGNTFGMDKTCTEWKTTTPGGLVADQAKKVLGNWADQLNLAEGVDQVVGALVSHFADKMVGGKQGFLGLSGSGSYSSQNMDYNTASELADDVNNPENMGLAEVNEAADGQINSLFPTTSVSSGNNVAKGKSVTVSSPGVGSSSWITDGDVTTSAASMEVADPSIQIDLGESVLIKEVHVWNTDGESAVENIGTFKVSVSGETGSDNWTSSEVKLTDTGSNPSVVSINKTGRYVEIERLDNSYACESGTCYYPLKIAEVEVISGNAITQETETADTETATEVKVGPSEGPVSIASGSAFNFTFPITSNKSTTISKINVTLYKGSGEIGFNSVFQNGSVGRKSGGITNFYSPNGASGIIFTDTPISPSSNAVITVSGNALSTGAIGTYKLTVSAKANNGDTLSTETVNFVVQ